MDTNVVHETIQLRREGLDGGHHEHRVGQASGPTSSPARRLDQRRRIRVDTDHERAGVRSRHAQDEPTVTGP
jgi:hypothetical protein